MREKSYSAYEEMIHIPLVVSNPLLYPEPRETQAFYSHLDLLPTLAELSGVPEFASDRLRPEHGARAARSLGERAGSVLFSYDDVFGLPAGASGANLRALRQEDWTYAVYFGIDGSGIEYELYDLATDPLQLKILLHESPPADVRSDWARLHRALTQKLVEAANLPVSFPWPIAPAA